MRPRSGGRRARAGNLGTWDPAARSRTPQVDRIPDFQFLAPAAPSAGATGGRQPALETWNSGDPRGAARGGSTQARRRPGVPAWGALGRRPWPHVQDGNTTQSVEQRCKTTYDSAQQADGYQVRYRLGDREGTVRMDHDPGRRIPVENGELVLTSLVDRQ